MFDLQLYDRQWRFPDGCCNLSETVLTKATRKFHFKHFRIVEITPLGFVDHDSVPDMMVSCAAASGESPLIDANPLSLEEITRTNPPSSFPARCLSPLLPLPSLTLPPHSSSFSVAAFPFSSPRVAPLESIKNNKTIRIADTDTATSFDSLSIVNAPDVAVTFSCAENCLSVASTALPCLSSSLSTCLPSSLLSTSSPIPSSSSPSSSSPSSSFSSSSLFPTSSSPLPSPSSLVRLPYPPFPAQPSVSFSFLPSFGTMRTIIKVNRTQIDPNFDSNDINELDQKIGDTADSSKSDIIIMKSRYNTINKNANVKNGNKKISNMVGLINGFNYSYGQKNISLSHDDEDDDEVVFYDDWLNPLDLDSLDTLTSRSVALTPISAVTDGAADSVASRSSISISVDSPMSTSAAAMPAIKKKRGEGFRHDDNVDSTWMPLSPLNAVSTSSSTSTASPSSSSGISLPLSLISYSPGVPPGSLSLDDDTIRRLKLLRYEKKRKHSAVAPETNDRGESQERDLCEKSDDQNNGVYIDIDTDVYADASSIDNLADVSSNECCSNVSNGIDVETSRHVQPSDLTDELLNTTAPADVATSTSSFSAVTSSTVEVEVSSSPIGLAPPMTMRTLNDANDNSDKEALEPIEVPLVTRGSELMVLHSESALDVEDNSSASLEVMMAVDRDEELRLLKRRERYLKVATFSSTYSLPHSIIYPLTC